MHDADTGTTAFADQPADPRVDFEIPETPHFDFGYLDPQGAPGSNRQTDGLSDKGATLAADTVFDYEDRMADGHSVIVSVEAHGREGTPISIDISVTMEDEDGSESISIVISDLPEGAALNHGTDNGDGSWTLSHQDLQGLTLTPPEFSDQDFTINIEVTSTESLSGDSHTTVHPVHVVIEAVADAPVLTVAEASGPEDSAIALDIRAELADTDGSETLTFVISGVPEGSALSAGTDNGDGTWSLTPGDLTGLTITPPTDLEADFDILVTATATESSNGDTASTTLPLHVDVLGVNDAPVASDIDLGQIQEDQPLNFTSAQLLAGASDTDGDTLAVTAVSADPAHGTITDNGDGTWTFTPTDNLTGEMSLSFIVDDGHGGTDQGLASLEILPVNDAPVVTGDVRLGTINEDTSVTFSEDLLLADIVDPEGDEMTVTSITADPACGSITDNGDGTWTFTPADNYHGSADISFTVADSHGASSAARATLDILPVNDPPESGGITELGQCPEDSSLTFDADELLSGVQDADGDALTVVSVTVDPARGTVTDNGDGTWTFTQTENFNGGANIIATVSDGNGGSGTAVSVVDVTAVNDAPVAGNVDLGQTGMDTAITFTRAQLLSNSSDVDGDTLTAGLVDVDPAFGAVTDNGDGTWTFTPASGFTGEDVEISFTVSDGNGGLATARALVDVTAGPNQPPVAGNVDLGAMAEDGTMIFSASQLLAGSSDPDGDALSVTAVTVNPAYGSVTDNGDGTWTFTPSENFHDFDVPLIFAVEDGQGGTNTAVALVDVIAAADLPVAGDVDLGQIDEDHSLTFSADRLLANTSEADGDPLSVASVSVNPAYGDIVDNGDGTWTFVPTENFHGEDIFLCFAVEDQDGRSTATASLDVLPVNDPPSAGDVDLGQCQAGATRIISAYDLLANSFDIEGDTLNVTEASVYVNPAYGEIQFLGGGIWAFTPAEGFTGENVPIRFMVSDGELETAAVALIDVVDDPSGNRPPVTGSVFLGSTGEDTPMTFSASDLLLATTDPDDDPLTVTAVGVNPAFGSVADNGDGTWTFAPAENFHGSNVPLTFTVIDGRGGFSIGTGVVDVLAANDAPSAGNVDLGQIREDQSIIITKALLLTDSVDPDGDTLNISAVTVAPANGTVTDNGDGTWTFTPAENFNGNDIALTFTVADGNGGTATGQATVDIIPVNDAPVASAVDLGQTQEDTPLTFAAATLLAGSTDIDGDALSVTAVSVDPAHGAVTDNGDGTWTFNPAADVNGNDIALTFTVSDGNGGTATGQATVDIIPVNDAPVASAVDLGQTQEDTPLTFAAATLLAGSTDIDGDALSVTAVSVDPAHGTVTDNGDGTWTFTPAANVNGDDLPLTFTVSDGNGGTATGQATVDIIPVNDAPVVIDDVRLGTINEDTSVTFSEDLLLADIIDPEGDAMTIGSITVDPAHGSVTDNGDGTWTFTPTENVSGDDIALTFTVSDPHGASSTAQAVVDILPVNDPPTSGGVTELGQCPEDSSLTFSSEDLLSDVHDAEGDTLTVATVTVDPSQGTVTDNGDGTWTFTPAGNFNGDANITYTVDDGNGGTGTAAAVVDVTAVNDAPVTADVDLGQTYVNTALTFSAAQLMANAYDPDGDALTVASVTVDPAFGAVTDNGDGTWTFIPAAGFTGDDTVLTFTVSDGNGGSAAAGALVDVTGGGNHPPLADDVDLGTMQEDGSLTFTAHQLLAGSSDPDGDALSIASVSVNPHFGAVTDNGDGTWTFAPAENFHGDDTALTFIVSDGNGGSAAAVALVDVSAAADLPVAGDVDLGSIDEDHALTFSAERLLANTSEADGDALSIASVSVNPHSGAITDNGDGTWTFTPAENFHGPVNIAFAVADADGHSSAAATLDVLAVNDPPLAGDVDLGQWQAGTSRVISTYELLANSSDVEGDALSVPEASVYVNPAYGEILSLGGGYWSFTPADGFTGENVPIRFMVSDGELETAAVALVDVVDDPSGNRPPVTSPVYLGATGEDTPFFMEASDLLLTTIDPDGDPLNITSVTVNPAYGSITDFGDGLWRFNPAQDFHGSDVPVLFTAEDGRGGFSTGVGIIDVLSVNDAPLAGNVDLGQSLEDSTLTITLAQLLAGSSDADGDTLDVTSLSADPAFGTVADNGDGTWTFTPAENFHGDDVSLTFTVDDGHGGTTTAQAVVDILPVSDAPEARDISLTVLEDTPHTFTQDMFAPAASDPDGDPLTVTDIFLDTPEAGSLADNGDGTWTFTPPHNSEVDASFTYVVSDGQTTDTARIDLAVDAVADPLNAANAMVGYIDGVYKLNLDFSAQFPESDGSEVYTVLSLSGLNSLPAGVQLLAGDDAADVLWSSGDGDTLTLTPEQAMGLTDIFIRCDNPASFDIQVQTRTVEVSNNDTAHGISTVHFDILNPPQLASYDVNSTDASMPDVFWYQTGDTTDPYMYATGEWFSADIDIWKEFAAFAESPLLINNNPYDPATNPDGFQGDGTVVIDNVEYNGDADNSIRISGFSTLINGAPDPDGDGSYALYDQVNSIHSALYDYISFTWSMADLGSSDLRVSPHLREQYGDQSMQIVSQNTENGIHFFDVQSVVMGYMNESNWVHESQYEYLDDFFSDGPYSVQSLLYPDYLQAGWDDRILFGDNGLDDVLRGEDSAGGDAKNNMLVGFGGDDVLVYGEGSDNLLGGAGDDQLIIDTEHHSGFLDVYALTDYVVPTLANVSVSPGDFGFQAVVEGKLDGGDGYDVLSLGAQGGMAGDTTLYLNYAEHSIGNEPSNTDTYPWLTYDPNEVYDNLLFWYNYNGVRVGSDDASFHYNMVNIEEIDITGDADDANTLNLNLDNVWLVTSDEYDKTLHITGDANDTLEIRDQQNWLYVDSDAGHHHYVSTTGLAHLYVDTDVEVHAVGADYHQGDSTVARDMLGEYDDHADDLRVDEGFHVALSGPGDDTITIDPLLHSDGHITPDDFTRIDGGDGFDVLRFGVNQALLTDIQMDLTALNAHQVENIEAIDITGNTHQANTLTLDASSVIDVTNAGNALYVQGDGNDTVHVSDAASWTHAGASDLGGVTYDHFTGLDAFGTAVDLYVQQEMMINLAHP
jgi:VCBS repeat-containing protein